jgi:peroxiredoxin Q/BCP
MSLKFIGEGDVAPDFELEDQNGAKIRLSDFKGRKVVLYFYPKDDTPGCTKEACSFRDNIQRISERNAVVLGVSADSVQSHKKFAQKYGLNFHILSDPEKKAITQYNVYVKKKMYGREYWGVERSTFIIDEQGKIKKAFRGVSVDGHVDQVLQEL